MTKQTHLQTGAHEAMTSDSNSSAATVVGFAIIGCLAAGVVGILKATAMETGSGVFLCLLASVAAWHGRLLVLTERLIRLSDRRLIVR